MAEQLREGRPPAEITVREFLGWFGAERRGYWVIERVRRALEKAGLKTEPDFEAVYLDSRFRFAQVPPSASTVSTKTSSLPPALESPPQVSPLAAITDPTSRISRLAAANSGVVSVAPDATLAEAITLMLASDFSQLPVMVNERDVKGVISWASIGARLGLGRTATVVRESMDRHHEVRSDESLFSAIPAIVQNQYVLIRGADNRITGIVTSSDLSLQFQQLSEPFLLLGEIENHVRRLIGDRFTADELAAARNPTDVERQIASAADLTFGEYGRLLEDPSRWARLSLGVDRKTFSTYLERVRGVRNDVMHFDPDPLPDPDLGVLRHFASFLQRLKDLGAT